MEQYNTIPASLTQPAFLPETDKPPSPNPLLRVGLYLALLAVALLVLKRLLR